MKEYIYNRLNMIKGLEERKLLRNILTGVFDEIVTHNNNMFDLLNRKISDEFIEPLSNFNIYSTVVNLYKVDPTSEIFSPIIQEDLEGNNFDLAKLCKDINEEGSARLCSVYMESNYRIIKRILRNKQSYTGRLITKTKEIKNFEFKLVQKTSYIEKVKRLYNVFNYNSKMWITINIPYVYRFFDIIITSPIESEEGEEIESFSINLREYDKYKRFEMIPLWNISRLKLQDISFPVPVKDYIHYEHKIAIDRNDLQNGYLLDYNDNNQLIPIQYIKREIKALTIVTNTEEQLVWDILRINNVTNKQYEMIGSSCMMNKRNMGFTDNYTNANSIIIRTKAELFKFITSYEISKDLIYEGMELKEEYYGKHYTYNLNSFIEDDIRSDNSKQVMVLRFKSVEKDDYLIYDKISFITSEVQMLFPEYKCVGELV